MKWSKVMNVVALVAIVIVLAVGAVNPIYNNIRLGLDLRGGTHLVLNLVDTAEAKVDEQARQGVIRIINDRINQFGLPSRSSYRRDHTGLSLSYLGSRTRRKQFALFR